MAPILGKVELLSFTKESTVRRWTALLSQRNRYEGSDKDDDNGVDDGDDDDKMMLAIVAKMTDEEEKCWRKYDDTPKEQEKSEAKDFPNLFGFCWRITCGMDLD